MMKTGPRSTVRSPQVEAVWKPWYPAFFTFALFYFCTFPAFAVPLTTGADFLLMTTGARPDGMGQAFSAVADDINTLSFNPAGLGNIRSAQVGYGYENFVAGVQYDFIGLALPVGNAGVLGLGYIDMGTAPFNSTANPSTPAVSAEDRAFIAGWGRSFYDFHVGIAGKYIQRQLDTVQGNGWGVDLGLRYRPAPNWTLAASLMNLGPGVQLSSLEPLPTLVNAGLAWTAVEQPFHSLTFAGNGTFNLATNTQQFGVGAEYWYQDAFALRAGYVLNSLDLGGDFNPDGFSAGAGIKLSFVELDYAFQPLNTIGMVHRFSGMLRWDGPFAGDGEPNPPKYVNVRPTARALEIRWDKALGPVKAYEVMIQPLDGGEMFLSDPVVNPIYYFEKFKPGVLYKISVKTIGPGGNRSFPSNEAYTAAPNEQQMARLTGDKEASTGQGVTGKVDGVGLQLSWPKTDGAVGGYNVYRKSPGGEVVKLTQDPKQASQVWLTDVSGLQGWEWIVTAVGEKGKERTLGSFHWYPGSAETDRILEKPVQRLTASPQKDRVLYLDWDSVPQASGYVILFSHSNDDIYEVFRDLNQTKPSLLLQIGGKHEVYHFLVVPKDAKGHWLKRSKEAVADLWNLAPPNSPHPLKPIR